MFSFQGTWLNFIRNSMKHHFHGVSVNLLSFFISFTDWKPSAAGFNRRGEADLRYSIELPVQCDPRKASFDEVVGQSGLEPPTSRLSVVCSSQLSYWPVSLTSSLLRYMVEISGIEPLTSCLQGRRSPSWAKPPYPLSFLYPLNWIMWNSFNTLYWP